MVKNFLMNILTFDIEEWHHLLDVKLDLSESQKDHTIVANFVDNILENLEEINTKATFFCLGESAKKLPSVIKKFIKLDMISGLTLMHTI